MEYSNDEILEAIRGNDENKRNQALKQLYLDPVVNGKVREMIAAYGAHRLDVDEVVQEGIILVDDLIRSGKYQAKSAVRTFLIGVCKNLIRSGGKKIERITYATEPLEIPETREAEHSPEDLVLLEEADEEAQKKDKILRRLLSELTDKCREVLHLYYFMARSLKEVAEERGLKNANQAKKAAKRCREQLKRKIEEQPLLANFLK